MAPLPQSTTIDECLKVWRQNKYQKEHESMENNFLNAYHNAFEEYHKPLDDEKTSFKQKFDALQNISKQLLSKGDFGKVNCASPKEKYSFLKTRLPLKIVKAPYFKFGTKTVKDLVLNAVRDSEGTYK